jgi:hypothetical protein
MRKTIKTIQNLFASAALLAIITFVGCKKEEVVQSTEMTDEQKLVVVKQTLETSKIFDNAIGMITTGIAKVGGLQPNDGGIVLTRGVVCTPPVVVPADLFSFPKTISYDFGTGCQDADGKTKSGKLTLKVGQLLAVGATIEATFDNYTEDGNKVNGTFNIVNNGILGASNLSVVGENITMTYKDGKTGTYNVRQTVKQVAGLANLDMMDDVYEVSSNLTGTLTDGTRINFQNTTPLKKSNACYWIQKGLALLKANDIPMVVDFGDDVCDNRATVTIGITTYNITL